MYFDAFLLVMVLGLIGSAYFVCFTEEDWKWKALAAGTMIVSLLLQFVLCSLRNPGDPSDGGSDLDDHLLEAGSIALFELPDSRSAGKLGDRGCIY